MARTNTHSVVWSDEMDTELKSVLEAGRSYSEAAVLLNAKFGTSFSRYACLGRSHRKGLAKDVKRDPKPNPTPRQRKPRSSSPVIREKKFRAEPFAPQVIEAPPSLGLSLIDLPDTACRYPYGEGPYTYCGHETMFVSTDTRSSYCEAHHRLCWVPPKQRKAESSRHTGMRSSGRYGFWEGGMTCLSTGTGSATHTFADRGDDLYETPPEATQALLKAFELPKTIWEPAAGRGAIVRVLEGAGHHVICSDKVDYGFGYPQQDFLTDIFVPPVDAIVTNPPFRHAMDFVRLGIQRSPLVVMLLRLAFLESERRRQILDNGHLREVLVFRNRLPMMHRDGWSGNKVSNPTAFAWFIWDRNHDGLTTLKRISWEAA